MLYTTIITHTDGTTTTITAQASSARDAHTHHPAMAGYIGLHPDVDTVRVYPATTDDNGNPTPDGVQAGALMVVRRTTANMICREGGDLQYRLYNACRQHDITDPDILDCISVATLAILDAISDGAPIAEQYHAAYLALNRYLRSSRQVDLSATAQRTLYIEDISGDIVNVTGAINRILRAAERYVPLSSDDNDGDAPSVAQIAAIKAIAATLTPTQLTVLRYLAKGYSTRQIADAMGRRHSTVDEHIARIRDKARTLYPGGYKTI